MGKSRLLCYLIQITETSLDKQGFLEPSFGIVQVLEKILYKIHVKCEDYCLCFRRSQQNKTRSHATTNTLLSLILLLEQLIDILDKDGKNLKGTKGSFLTKASTKQGEQASCTRKNSEDPSSKTHCYKKNKQLPVLCIITECFVTTGEYK